MKATSQQFRGYCTGTHFHILGDGELDLRPRGGFYFLVAAVEKEHTKVTFQIKQSKSGACTHRTARSRTPFAWFGMCPGGHPKLLGHSDLGNVSERTVAVLLILFALLGTIT